MLLAVVTGVSISVVELRIGRSGGGEGANGTQGSNAQQRSNGNGRAKRIRAFHLGILGHSVFFNFSDPKRVNQRSASDSRGFGPDRSKKASHLVKPRKLTGALLRGCWRPYMATRPPTEISMTSQAVRLRDARFKVALFVFFAWLLGTSASAIAADEPDLIFRRSTVFKLLSPNDKLATYGVDDPRGRRRCLSFHRAGKGRL